MSISYTNQQEAAIESRGNALLVSAAAGSGKTAVLVERVKRYLLQENGDLQRLMIMTYTRAAAEELKQKLKKALDEEGGQYRGGTHLLRQSALIDSAEIGTIHSICLNLITRHFELLDLDPRCRLMDEAAEEALSSEEADAFLETLYGSEEEAVQRFLAYFSTGREDEGLKALLLEGMNFLEDQPMPTRFIERALAPYDHADETLFSCFLEDGLYRFLENKLEALQAEYHFLVQRVKNHAYLRQFPALLCFLKEEHQQLLVLSEVLARRDYDAFAAALSGVRFGTLYWNKLTEKDGDLVAREALKALREGCKETWKAFCAVCAQTEREELRRLKAEGEVLGTYFTLCNGLMTRLQRRRRKEGFITYQDMEHEALKLLVEDYDPAADRLTPTPLALRLREDYDEIIIDEFQDSNRAQDLIFRALSREGKNLFMVGDIKQSIYRFRGAEPELFADKRARFSRWSDREMRQPAVLELNANFRSHPGVLTFVNQVFENIMSPSLGGVVYDARERLTPGRRFLDPESTVTELHWLPEETDPDTGRRMDRSLQTARYTAQRIRQAVENREELLAPDEGRRPVQYRDFAVLLRTASGAAALFERAFSEAGVPVVNHNEGVAFYELKEVLDILSYLLVLNNPYDDLALATLLYGAYFSFSVGELAALRHPGQALYDCLKAAAEEKERARYAYQTIERYRSLAGAVYVYDLLDRIYQECGIFAYYAKMPGGAEKSANLELLAEEARQFEVDGYRGLYAFVQYVRISKAGASKNGARLSAEENSVQILSVHKSKGLEFPVCILADAQKSLNWRDSQGTLLLHPRYGAALEHREPELYFCRRSLSQSVLAAQMAQDSVSEEERVLYVALTRAQSRLIVVAAAETKKMERWVQEGAYLPRPFPTWALLRRDASFGRWLFTLLAGAPEGALLREQLGFPAEGSGALRACFVQGALSALPPRVESKAAEEAKPDRRALQERLEWRYPHLSAVRLPAKLSVSELKGLREADPEAQPLLAEQPVLPKPRFASHFRARGNEVGNAMHQALQFCDFSGLLQDPERELTRLVEEGFLLEAQRVLILPDQLRRFTASDCFRRLFDADYYKKEERFLFPMPAARLFGPDAEGEVLIQGVLDCYAVTGEEAVILDYKTDRVQTEEELIARYRVQMDLYTEALRRVKKLRVKERILYSFFLEKEIYL